METISDYKAKMDLNKITDIIFNLNKAYDKYKEGKIINNNWVITDPDFYNKYKNKILINYAKINTNEQTTTYGEYILKDKYIYIETKKYYGIIKYNTNFVACILSETEYGLYTKNMNMVAVNTKLIDNYEKLNNEPPKIEDLLKIIKWKITKKALQELKYNIE